MILRDVCISVVACVVGAFLLVASSAPPTPQLPSKGELFYDHSRSMILDPATNVRNFSILGQRGYVTTGGTEQQYSFLFDEPRDQLTLVINDNVGLAPGQAFSYTLYIKDARGVVKSSHLLRTANPFSAVDRAFRFEFVISTNGPAGLKLPQGMPLVGIYELGESQRDLAVDIKFDLKTSIQYSSVSADYD